MPTSPSVRVRRTLHLIDADNLLGDSRTCDSELIADTFAKYRRAAGFVHGDHAVVATGTNGRHVYEVERAWRGVCHRRRRGVDGADLTLLEEAEWVASGQRFDRVVIGSGDHIFILAYDQLIAAGLTVDVVSRREALSTALAERARGRVRFLSPIVPRSPRPAHGAHEDAA